MKVILRFVCIASLTCGTLLADNNENENESKKETPKFSFTEPVRLKAGDELISTEAPGYACPCYHDFDNDGLKDLIVGQFSGGKMKMYRNTGEGNFAAGQWIKADGEPASVPGVW